MEDDYEKWNQDDQLCWPRSCSGRNYERYVACNESATKSSKVPIWKVLWRRIKKEKKRIFPCSNSSSASISSMRFNYDPNSYSQNFDEGLNMCDDPDDLSRSFSARFAVSSRFFDKNSFDGLKEEIHVFS